MKFRDVRRRLRNEDWTLARKDGSHEIWKRKDGSGRVVLAGHDGDDVPPGTLNSIRKQVGWK